jgi:hypothetical protein
LERILNPSYRLQRWPCCRVFPFLLRFSLSFRNF